MRSLLLTLPMLGWLTQPLFAADSVLIVADERPAMEVLAARLRSAAQVETRIVEPSNLPPSLAGFKAVFVYIHGNLAEPAERAFIDYTQAGGKLVTLHHSISSGKRKNKYWFEFLGIELPTGDVAQGGYKWTEPATLEIVNLAPGHFVTTHQVPYPTRLPYRREGTSGEPPALPGFALPDSEVYLNHTFTRPRTVLLGFKYRDPQSGVVYMQDRAGWHLPAGKGEIFYFKPGHSTKDFENPAYAQILANTLTTPSPASAPTRKESVVITAGDDWLPLQPELEIAPGSALDFSSWVTPAAPAGRLGRIIVNAQGHFAFASNPRKPQRFYGVNLCFGAQYLAHAEADRLADRLARLGYNSVRIHHYESELVAGQSDSTQPNPAKLDQLDYLLAALAKRGLYLTTDLYVSRPVRYEELGFNRTGPVPMNTFKMLVPVHEGAWNNWKRFTRALLLHVNPYTGKSYASDPALAWLSMINEGNFGNYVREMREIPEWTTAWNQWLRDRYGSREKLANAWGGQLKPDEDFPAVALPENLSGPGLRVRDCLLFLAHTEKTTVQRMTRFLRDELHCHALITNANAWTNHAIDQEAREIYDYVDDHFYVDHPEFLEQSWRLPSRCGNLSPVASGATGGRDRAFTRLFGKPFTITEYNYSGPGRYRGVGGLLTGALGALQDWDGIWRFAYSHSRNAMFEPARMNYFDTACDPLNQAADRASLCLFLRGDMMPAPHSVAIGMSHEDFAHPPARIPRLNPRWSWIAWITRIGTETRNDPRDLKRHQILLPLGWSPNPERRSNRQAGLLDPYSTNQAPWPSLLRDTGILAADNPTDPARPVLKSETGEMFLDAPRNLMVFDTPKTAGGFGPAGSSWITAQGGVRFAIQGYDATVWVTSLDGQPIRQSRHLLVTHLTDLQNTRIQYAEPACQTLLDWGSLPYLVRVGQAQVSLDNRHAKHMRIWALSPGGRRLGTVPTQATARGLSFVADVAGDRAHGARMLYEIQRTP
jgi:hypothetical protein